MEVDGDKVGMGEREALLQKAKLAEQVGKRGNPLIPKIISGTSKMGLEIRKEIPKFLIWDFDFSFFQQIQ